MDAQFLESIFSSPPTVLGRTLKPFCCGHAVALDVMESPFVRGGNATVDDLLAAIWVCSQTFEECRSKMSGDRGLIVDECVEWGKTVSDVDMQTVNETFQKYLIEFTQAPQRWKKKETKAGKAPWALTVATVLMKEMKMSETEAWNMPLPKALWYFASLAEANGDNSLVSEQERERMAVAKEMSAEVSNG